MTETRRRRAPKSAPAPEPVETPAEVMDTPPPAPAPAPEPYRTGRWHGHENYTCARCDFATLRRALIEDHVRTAHAAGRR